MISRSGKCPWRTSRWRPSLLVSSAYLLSKVATSASTACARSARAPSRNTSVSGSIKLLGWDNWKTLVLVTAYHSFAGKVEALNTPTIRRLTPSRRHQLSPIALSGIASPINTATLLETLRLGECHPLALVIEDRLPERQALYLTQLWPAQNSSLAARATFQAPPARPHRRPPKR
jgi:hypothetical protein